MANYDAVFWHYDGANGEYYAEYMGEELSVALDEDEYDDIEFRRACEEDIRENWVEYRI